MIRRLSYRTIVIAMVSTLVLVPVACGKKGPLERPAATTVNSVNASWSGSRINARFQCHSTSVNETGRSGTKTDFVFIF